MDDHLGGKGQYHGIMKTMSFRRSTAAPLISIPDHGPHGIAVSSVPTLTIDLCFRSSYGDLNPSDPSHVLSHNKAQQCVWETDILVVQVSPSGRDQSLNATPKTFHPKLGEACMQKSQAFLAARGTPFRSLKLSGSRGPDAALPPSPITRKM
jgi:hypothetical protein